MKPSTRQGGRASRMRQESSLLDKPEHVRMAETDSILNTLQEIENETVSGVSQKSRCLFVYMKLARELESAFKEQAQLTDVMTTLLKVEEKKTKTLREQIQELTASAQKANKDAEKKLSIELRNARAMIEELNTDNCRLKLEKMAAENKVRELKRKMESSQDRRSKAPKNNNMTASSSSGFEERDHSSRRDMSTDRSEKSCESSDIDYTDCSVLSGGLITVTTPKRPTFPCVTKPPRCPTTSERYQKKHAATAKYFQNPEGNAATSESDEEEDAATPVVTHRSRDRNRRPPVMGMQAAKNNHTTPAKVRRSCSVPLSSPLERGESDAPLVTMRNRGMTASIDDVDVATQSQCAFRTPVCRSGRVQSAIDVNIPEIDTDESVVTTDNETDHEPMNLYGNPVLDRVHQFCQKRTYSRDICDVCGKSVKFSQLVKKCEACRQLAHTECAIRLHYPCAPRSAGPKDKKGVLAQPLQELVHPEVYPQIPHLVIVVVHHLNQFHLTEEGLYRVQAVQSDVDRLYSELMTHRRIPLLRKYSAATLTGVLKRFLGKAIKGQLISRCSLGDLVTGDLDDQNHVMESLLMLPLPNRDTLSLLALHWRKVAEMAHENGMTVDNLARVLSPTIFFSSGPNQVSINDQIHALRSIIFLPEEFHMQHMAYDGPMKAALKTPGRKTPPPGTWRGDGRRTPAFRSSTIRRNRPSVTAIATCPLEFK